MQCNPSPYSTWLPVFELSKPDRRADRARQGLEAKKHVSVSEDVLSRLAQAAKRQRWFAACASILKLDEKTENVEGTRNEIFTTGVTKMRKISRFRTTCRRSSDFLGVNVLAGQPQCRTVKRRTIGTRRHAPHSTPAQRTQNRAKLCSVVSVFVTTSTTV
jgi:hypothetical protein